MKKQNNKFTVLNLHSLKVEIRLPQVIGTDIALKSKGHRLVGPCPFKLHGDNDIFYFSTI